MTERPLDLRDGRRPGHGAVGGDVDVSIVVVSWNTRDDLRRCLSSVIRETADETVEVFVVDNASADGSPDMVRSEFPDVTLIANSANLGFAAANNQALRRARGRYALLLNPDTTVVDGAVGRALRVADADPSVGVLGCQVLLSEATRDRAAAVQMTCFRFPSAFGLLLISTGIDRVLPRTWCAGGPTMKDWDRLTARDVDVVSGMFMLVRREAVARVGLMDEDYFVYAEEADWCYRIRKAGWRCSFTPAAQIVHHGGGGRSTSQVRVRMHVQLQKSILVFHRKNLGLASFLAVKSIYLATNAMRAALWNALALFSRAGAARDRARCAVAALRFHVTGRSPARAAAARGAS